MNQRITHWHCCIALDKLLELTLKGNGDTFLDHPDGTPLTETEVYQLVREEKAKGYKFFSSCDARGADGRCKGHQQKGSR